MPLSNEKHEANEDERVSASPLVFSVCQILPVEVATPLRPFPSGAIVEGRTALNGFCPQPDSIARLHLTLTILTPCDQIFEPGISAGAVEVRPRPGLAEALPQVDWAAGRQYLLQPIGGKLQYLRRGKRDARLPHEPFQRVAVVLDEVALTVQEVSRATRRRPTAAAPGGQDWFALTE